MMMVVVCLISDEHLKIRENFLIRTIPNHIELKNVRNSSSLKYVVGMYIHLYTVHARGVLNKSV